MNQDKTQWWMLQIQLPLVNNGQLEMFVEPISRVSLLGKVCGIIPSNIRVTRGERLWGLADFKEVEKDLLTFKLIVSTPKSRVAEEPEPGRLKETRFPRFFTLCVLDAKKQILFINKYSYVSRFARSANTFAEIFQNLISNAINFIEKDELYFVEVDPIAQLGSFVEWVESVDVVKNIVIKYTGPNLPSGNSRLISEIRDVANRYQKNMRSRDVDLVANKPKLEQTEIEDLDKAVANRRLKMRARGTKADVDTSWSSQIKPVAETAQMPITEEELENEKKVANTIKSYIDQRFIEPTKDD